MHGTAVRRWRGLTVAVVVLALAGCTVRRSGPTEENSVAQQVQQTGRFDVDLSGPMPDREQLGLASGQTQNTLERRGEDPVEVAFVLAGGRSFSVPSSSVTVATPADYVVDPRHPDRADDDLLPPNEVIATQDVDSAAAAEQILSAHADVLGLDRTDIARWLASAPPEPGPGVLLDKHYFATTRIGYVDVTVAVFISDNAYLNFDLTWDPPIPGYAYTTDGIPRPTAS